MAVTLLASCTDKEDHSGDFGQIKVPDTRQLEQTVTADDTQAAQGVTFSTEGAWTSSIAQTRADAPNWIAISPDHGDAAGTYTLKIALGPNTTAETREARITITCGTSKIEILVTQTGSGTPEDPDDPSVTPTPQSKWLVAVVDQYSNATDEENSTFVFEYDVWRRLISIKVYETGSEGNEPHESITIAYPDSRKIRLASSLDDLDYEILLDAQGRAVRENLTAEKTDTGYNTYVYDQAGYCTEYRHYSADGKEVYPRAVFTWVGGNLSTFKAYKPDGSSSSDFLDETFEYSGIKNDPAITNIDLNALLQVYPYPAFEISCSNILAMIGALGPRSANLTTTDRSYTYAHMGGGDEEGTWMYYTEEVQQPVEWTIDAEGRATQAVSVTVLTHYKKYFQTGKIEEIDRREYKNTLKIRYTE